MVAPSSLNLSKHLGMVSSGVSGGSDELVCWPQGMSVGYVTFLCEVQTFGVSGCVYISVYIFIYLRFIILRDKKKPRTNPA